VFVNSVSGAKQYQWSEGGWSRYAGEGVRLRRAAENTQFFQTVTIDGDALRYEAWTADGQLYDAFALEKDKSGVRRERPAPESTLPNRTFTNTGRFEDPDGLNK
ncbi:MAG: hypothetical protein EBZ50_05830, partial [Alphaproteobacteria bacterium]|nr:hypothetical protein [Alphaproteobacteria bacterium]